MILIKSEADLKIFNGVSAVTTLRREHEPSAGVTDTPMSGTAGEAFSYGAFTGQERHAAQNVTAGYKFNCKSAFRIAALS